MVLGSLVVHKFSSGIGGFRQRGEIMWIIDSTGIFLRSVYLYGRYGLLHKGGSWYVVQAGSLFLFLFVFLYFPTLFCAFFFFFF